MPKLERIPALINYLGFQAAWFSIVLSAAAGRSEFGIALALLLVVLQLAVLVQIKRELCFVFLVAVIGSLLDGLVMYLGAFSFPVASPSLWPYPLWMSALWLSFAMTLNHSMLWLKSRYLVAALLGAICGPLCYIAAQSFGAINLLEPLQFSLTAISLCWTVAMLLITYLQQRFS